jgi:N-acetylglucosamine-6-phosphate deacetylase
MDHGELKAWDALSGHYTRLAWRDGIITTLERLDPAEECRLWMAPAGVDLQVNGFGGVDFQQDDLPLPELLRAVRLLRSGGCGRFLLTLMTDAWPALLRRLSHLRSLRASCPELHRAILGWHLEGPFLSSEPGFHGAHAVEHTCDPAPERIRELRQLTGSDCVLLTLAPERRGALEAIAQARALGMTVCLGHTNASAEVLRQARLAGAQAFTHLSNGCPPRLDRQDNILWRVLDAGDWLISLIPDGIHVSPPLFRILHRLLPADSVFYVTDAMAAAGAPPGRYRLGRLELEIGDDRVVRLPGTQQFAGSALEPLDAARRAARMRGCPWTQTWPHMSRIPCRLLNLPDPWQPGQPADLVVLAEDEDNELRLHDRIGGDNSQ